MVPATILPSPRPPRLDPRPWPAAPSSPRHPGRLHHHQQQPLRQHGLLFQAALSSPSLLSPPLRWRTIDLRNEVGLLSRIYTRFSLCVSDRFHPARHSLSLRIFMLVRARQRTHQQGEDASKPSLPLAASPGPLGRGFLGLRSFFPPSISPSIYHHYHHQPHHHRAFNALPARPARIWMLARTGLFSGGLPRTVPSASSARSDQRVGVLVVTFPTAVTRGVTCLAAPRSRPRVAAGAAPTLMGCDSPRRQLPAHSLPGRHFFFVGRALPSA